MAWRGVAWAMTGYRCLVPDLGLDADIDARCETRARYRLSLVPPTSDEYYEALYGLEVQVLMSP